MPELPEVETMRRSLLPSVQCEIRSVACPASRYRPIVMEPRLEDLQQRLVGRSIVDVARLGKRVVVQVDDGSSLLFQPKMAGLVLMDTPPNQTHVRLVIELVTASPKPIKQITYWDQRGLGTVRLWTAQQMETYLASGQLGPDAIAVSFETFYRRFHESSRPVKPALLDQTRLAGIGNLYASEILHQSLVHPETRCDRISRANWDRIFQATQTILLRAIEHEGSTLSDGTYRKSKENPGSYQNSHRVYDRHGQPCLTCGKDSIVRTVQSKRSTFYCPTCQKKRESRNKAS